MKKNEQDPKKKKDLIDAQLKREAGDKNRTTGSSKGKIEVTALKEPSVRREVRSMPRTSKAVADALVKKPAGKQQEKAKGAAPGNKRPR